MTAQALETPVGASTVENRCVLDNESHAGVCCADSAGAEKEENKKSVRGSGDDLLFLKNRAVCLYPPSFCSAVSGNHFLSMFC